MRTASGRRHLRTSSPVPAEAHHVSRVLDELRPTWAATPCSSLTRSAVRHEAVRPHIARDKALSPPGWPVGSCWKLSC